MALTGYFDGSLVVGKCRALTCVAADDVVWTELEEKWKQVLKERGNAPYLHMTDAISLNGVYEGWTPEERDDLIEGCLSVLNSYMDNPRIHSFTASVDLAAYDRWKSSKKHPSPERLCVRIVFPHVLDWYGTFSDRIIGMTHFYFDRNEPFMRHIRADWENKRIRRLYPAWSLVKTIEAIPMQTTPQLQMADLICWGFHVKLRGLIGKPTNFTSAPFEPLTPCVAYTELWVRKPYLTAIFVRKATQRVTVSEGAFEKEPELQPVTRSGKRQSG